MIRQRYSNSASAEGLLALVEEDESTAELVVSRLSLEVPPRQLLSLRPLNVTAEDLDNDLRQLARRLAEIVSASGSRRVDVYAKEIARLGEGCSL